MPGAVMNGMVIMGAVMLGVATVCNPIFSVAVVTVTSTKYWYSSF